MKMIKRTLFLPLAMMAAVMLLASSPARAVVEIDINREQPRPFQIGSNNRGDLRPDGIIGDEIGNRDRQRLDIGAVDLQTQVA